MNCFLLRAVRRENQTNFNKEFSIVKATREATLTHTNEKLSRVIQIQKELGLEASSLLPAEMKEEVRHSDRVNGNKTTEEPQKSGFSNTNNANDRDADVLSQVGFFKEATGKAQGSHKTQVSQEHYTQILESELKFLQDDVEKGVNMFNSTHENLRRLCIIATAESHKQEVLCLILSMKIQMFKKLKDELAQKELSLKNIEQHLLTIVEKSDSLRGDLERKGFNHDKRILRRPSIRHGSIAGLRKGTLENMSDVNFITKLLQESNAQHSSNDEKSIDGSSTKINNKSNIFRKNFRAQLMRIRDIKRTLLGNMADVILILTLKRSKVGGYNSLDYKATNLSDTMVIPKEIIHCIYSKISDARNEKAELNRRMEAAEINLKASEWESKLLEAQQIDCEECMRDFHYLHLDKETSKKLNLYGTASAPKTRPKFPVRKASSGKLIADKIAQTEKHLEAKRRTNKALAEKLNEIHDLLYKSGCEV